MSRTTQSKVDFGDLHAFAVLATELSFAAAAEKLNISASALSRRIQKLEAFLNTQLFIRSTRQVELTAVGKELLLGALELIRTFDEMVLALEERYHPPTQRVTLACVPSATSTHLAAVFQEFARQHPKAQLHIVDSTGTAVIETVLAERADFGITYLGQDDADLEFLPLLMDEFILAARPNGRFADVETLAWDELGDEPIVTAWAGAGIRMLMNRELARRKFSLSAAYEVRHIDTAIDLANAGIASAIVPQLVLARHNTRGLRAVPLVNPTISRTLGLIRLRRRELSPPAATLWNLVSTRGGDAGEPIASI
jgi:DNA-binding transcriptional LysR family regulator